MDPLTLQLPAFLREHGVDELARRFQVKAVRHREFPNLVLFKYSQIDSPMAEPIVQECRGLILDESDDWRPISVPYFKFFNAAEPLAAVIDWSTARVYEKLDGSLMTIYAYAGRWHVSSRNVPDASGPVGSNDFTMADLFWRTWQQLQYTSPPVDVGRCYMFELLTPHNRIVVQHAVSRLVLHGCRNLSDLREVRPEDGALPGWEVVRTFELSTLEGATAAAAELEPLAAEGYVVCDGSFNRVKIKSPRYVALSLLKDSLSPRQMLNNVRLNESSEFLAYFPELRPVYETAKAKFDALCDEAEADYARLSSITDQREFAAEALKTKWSSPLFALRSGKFPTVRAFAASATQQSVERALGENFSTAATTAE